MTEQHEYEYYEHVRCKRQYNELNYYIQEQFATENKPTPQAITEYGDYLKARFQANPISIFDLPESEYRMSDDGRYPSEQFLISLSETWIDENTRENYDKLMRIVSDVWYCMRDEDIIDYHNGRYELYDGGWSGNEDITDAMLRNPSITLLCEIDASTCILKVRYRFADRDANEEWI